MPGTRRLPTLICSMLLVAAAALASLCAAGAPAYAADYVTVICPEAMQQHMGVGNWGNNGHADKAAIKAGKVVLSPGTSTATKLSGLEVVGVTGKRSYKLAKNVKYYRATGYPANESIKFAGRVSKAKFLKLLKRANGRKWDKADRLVMRMRNGKVVKIGFGTPMGVYTPR